MIAHFFKENLAETVSLACMVLSAYVMYKEFNKSRKTDDLKGVEELPLPEIRYYSHCDLEKYNGVDNPSIYIAIKGEIYDVSASESMYGKGKAYGLFSGHDATIALAKESLDDEHILPNNGPIADVNTLSKKEEEVLNEWLIFYRQKYNIIGLLVDNEDKRAGKPLDEESRALINKNCMMKSLPKDMIPNESKKTE